MRANVVVLFGLLSTFLLLSSCVSGQGTRDSYDFIIVGAGSAGSVVAGELAKACGSCSLLLIEAGGDATTPKIHNTLQQSDLAFSPVNSYLRDDHISVPSVNYYNRRISNIRGKMLGGTFGVNAMFHVVGDPSDWDTTASDIEDSKWNWKKTNKYRKRIRREFDIFEYDTSYPGGQLYVDAAAALGLAYDSDIEDGIHGIGPGAQVGTFNPSRPGGIRQTSFDLKILHADVPNVEILTFHHVTKVLINSNKVATGVQVLNVRSNETYSFSASREVILSAGAFRTPQILMLSGIGPQSHLQSFGIPVIQDLPAVGSNLEDHLSIQTYWENKVAGTTAPFLFSAPSFNIFGPETAGRPSYQLEISPGFISVTPNLQKVEGTVRLGSVNPLQQPVVTYNLTPEWEDAILWGTKNLLFPFIDALRARNVFGYGYTDVQPGASDQTIREYIRSRIDTNFHPTGTARVGKSSDPNAVVDSHFRVRGIQHLRVVDASVFRVEPTGNINAPTLLLGYFAADLITDDNNL